MLLLPYVLDGLVDEEHNAGRGGSVADPFSDLIMAVDELLHWYWLAQTPEPSDDNVALLTDNGKAPLLVILERVFSFKVSYGNDILRSMWCTEKVHSILHAPKDSQTYGQVLPYPMILAHTALIVTHADTY
jgi:hypothetical protein